MLRIIILLSEIKTRLSIDTYAVFLKIGLCQNVIAMQ